MKKSTVLACIGVVIAFLIVLTLGNKKDLYEKQVTFKTPEEAIVNFIGYANVMETVKIENGLYERPSRKFLESVSRRYRLYMGDNSWSYIGPSIPNFFDYELQEISQNNADFIIDDYELSLKGVPSYIKPKEIRFFSLTGNGTYERYNNITPNEDGTIDNKLNDESNNKKIPLALYLVVVNEGEGYVVDFYII